MESFRTFESVFVIAVIGGTSVVSEFLKQQLECFLSALKSAKIRDFHIEGQDQRSDVYSRLDILLSYSGLKAVHLIRKKAPVPSGFDT